MTRGPESHGPAGRKSNPDLFPAEELAQGGFDRRGPGLRALPSIVAEAAHNMARWGTIANSLFHRLIAEIVEALAGVASKKHKKPVEEEGC